MSREGGSSLGGGEDRTRREGQPYGEITTDELGAGKSLMNLSRPRSGFGFDVALESLGEKEADRVGKVVSSWSSTSSGKLSEEKRTARKHATREMMRGEIRILLQGLTISSSYWRSG
jgi:hypothetical protein